MPRAFASDDSEDLVRAERLIRDELGDLDLDLHSLAVVSNIFRVATAVRNHMEGTVLAENSLSWSAFVVLFVLRVWGDQESRDLAAEAGITGGTLTGVVKTLERRGLARRDVRSDDRRRVVVSLTERGRATVDDVMPSFNRHEALVTSDLSSAEAQRLAASLRKVLRTVERLDRRA